MGGCFAGCLSNLHFKRIKVLRGTLCVFVRGPPPPLLFGSPDEVILQQLHLRSERGDGILRIERGAGVNTAREATSPGD